MIRINKLKNVHVVWTKVVVTVMLIGIVAMSPLFSQTGRGKIRLAGDVKGEDGEPIAEATVEIRFVGRFSGGHMVLKFRKLDYNEARGEDAKVKFSTKTDKNGEWGFLNVGYGRWELTVSHKEYVTQKREMGVRLLERNPRISFVLKKGEIVLGDKVTRDVLKKNAHLVKDGPQLSKKKEYHVLSVKMGEFCLEKGELSEAISYFALAAELKPKWGEPHLRLGYSLMDFGDNKKALKHFEKFLKLDPQNPEAETVQILVETLKEM
jgi:tetratricopeptide (TPR) repeat protein